MLKQCRLEPLCFGKYCVYLYHNGELVLKEERWDGKEFDEYLDKLNADGYEQCYTQKEVEAAKRRYEIYSNQMIGGAPRWKHIGSDYNDMDILQCPICGRKQFVYSKYCPSCGTPMNEFK